MDFKDTALKHTLGGRIMAGTAIFVYDSLEAIIMWLIVMFCVILVDFIAGSRKSLIMKEPYRVSRAIRATMGKMCTYFSFVVTVVFVEHASGIDGLAKWAILLVCAGEGISIINNLLIPKGYSINIISVLQIMGKKLAGVPDAGKILNKTDSNEKETEA